MLRTVIILSLTLLFFGVSCSKEKENPKVETPKPEKVAAQGSKPADTNRSEPDRIKVQHILIGFKDAVGFRGNVPKKARGRTQEEAKKLAEELLGRAKKGEDFDALVKEFTDDSHPGIYGMVNFGKSAKPGYLKRSKMVPAFGDTGFPLEVGEIGMSEYNLKKSPYGWHIVKRIE